MDTIKEQLVQAVTLSLNQAHFKFSEPVVINYPKVSSHGDYTTNVAMIVAKKTGQTPMAVADRLTLQLKKTDFVKSGKATVEAVAPGFINFKLSPEFISELALAILAQTRPYGQNQTGQGKKIQIEFISANPTGPLTIGNARGGFFGDVLGNAYKACGYKVVKEYYVNDAGKQIESLGHSVLKDELAVYKGDYIDDLHNKLKGAGDEANYVGRLAAQEILNDLLKKTIEEKMKIKFDVWFSEYDELRQTNKTAMMIDYLKNKKLIYQKDGAWWFKSSDHGDVRDRVLVKTNGETTYLAQDFAYLQNKFTERKFDKVIYVWGADHHGDVAGLLNAAKVLGHEGKAEVILLQFVRLLKDGKEVRMSKRKGNYIKMTDLIDVVGHDVARFMFLMYAPSSHIDFDLNVAQEKSEKNPVYYLQYAFARISSLLSQPEVGKVKSIKQIKLDHRSALSLAAALFKWPEILEEAAANNRVQLLPTYALDLANKFHHFYDQCRVINNGEANPGWVALIRLTHKVLLEVINVIGVEAPAKM